MIIKKAHKSVTNHSGALTTTGLTQALVWLLLASTTRGSESPRYSPEDGFYAFESGTPKDRPPRVRKPPYLRSGVPCPTESTGNPRDTLCGDLNRGVIPLNPMGQSFRGDPYPFQLIKNKTLEYMGKLLPYLTSDPRLPQVAKFSPRYRRDLQSLTEIDLLENEDNRTARAFCDDSQNSCSCLTSVYGSPCVYHNAVCRMCSLWNNSRIPLHLLLSVAQTLLTNNSPSTTPAPLEVKDEGGGGLGPWITLISSLATGEDSKNRSPLSQIASLLATASSSALLSQLLPTSRRRKPPEEPQTSGDPDLPPTPCPSNEEYVTPVFARNYQGVWKYVVQIPQEGYFTQTVQQTRCRRGRCELGVEGGVCHESPRWVSLLVAELFYPDAVFPPPPVEDFHDFQQYLHRRVGSSDGATHCDGVDRRGCFLVRVYHDWFLVNGSCKCWQPAASRLMAAARRKESHLLIVQIKDGWRHLSEAIINLKLHDQEIPFSKYINQIPVQFYFYAKLFSEDNTSFISFLSLKKATLGPLEHREISVLDEVYSQIQFVHKSRIDCIGPS
ncbi:hypothetical protein LAZ67_1007589 [Cordylochernes scorpioides]|uniref:Uncharacterized protein n=1 Tax=Cordylochernes scorpioides TaxID=51811 RepID=A0ABY6K2D8_9ARAC|nr:hypothetical protein LAZ67_1007589 [Cordylochernes scorpioides]